MWQGCRGHNYNPYKGCRGHNQNPCNKSGVCSGLGSAPVVLIVHLGQSPDLSKIVYRLPLTEMPSRLRTCIEVKDLTPTGLRPRPKGLRVFTRGRPTDSLHITAFVRVKITFDYDK